MWPFKKKNKPKFRRCIVRGSYEGEITNKLFAGYIIRECGPDYLEIRFDDYEYITEIVNRNCVVWIEDNIKT